jgi:hypothetical protein
MTSSQDLARTTPAYTPAVDRHLTPAVRVARLTADVAARLGPACAGMPTADFDALVDDIARLKLRWAEAPQAP